MSKSYTSRIEALRELMKSKGWDAVVICGTDPHSSEYPASRWKQVEWLTGFTGEAGDVVITATEAGLWTDSRYFIQAESQLAGTGVVLHKTRQPDSVYIPQWLSEKDLKTIAVDGLCMSVDFAGAIENASAGSELVEVPDILSAIWTDRPDIPVTPIVTLDVECFGGEQRQDKIAWLRGWMLQHECSHMLLSSLDEIAWMLNVRGNDIEYNPLVISYLLVSQEEVRWFVRKDVEHPDPDTEDSFAELEADDIIIDDYTALEDALSVISEDPETRLFIDPSTLNHHISSHISNIFERESVINGRSPVILRKSVRTESEIKNLRQTYIEDGVAMECFLYWLDKEVSSGREITEWEASERLTAFREQIPGYRGHSFENISAYGPNAALPHYSTPHEGSAVIRPKGLYLVDSGGQYLTGTTDITRTVPMGECSDLEKEDYTLVLKGMIDLSMAVFPKGTAGCQIDAMARMPLWRARRNFGHGTGHGIGYWLCVHEGPQDIRQNFNAQPLLPGMVTSNEPGLYREGNHGIRHENIVLCREAGASEFGDWLSFETLTCCHIDTSAVIPELLGKDALEWLDEYNSRVYETLSPHLPQEVAEWLADRIQNHQ